MSQVPACYHQLFIVNRLASIKAAAVLPAPTARRAVPAAAPAPVLPRRGQARRPEGSEHASLVWLCSLQPLPTLQGGMKAGLWPPPSSPLLAALLLGCLEAHAWVGPGRAVFCPASITVGKAPFCLPSGNSSCAQAAGKPHGGRNSLSLLSLKARFSCLGLCPRGKHRACLSSGLTDEPHLSFAGGQP